MFPTGTVGVALAVLRSVVAVTVLVNAATCWPTGFGLIVGAIAKLLMPGKDPGGFIVTILLGIAGAFIASYLGQALGWYKAGQPAGWIMSIVGAMILLLLYRLLFKRKQ